MANLLQKASIVLTPTAYDNGKVLCAKPSEPPYGDFDFSRNSAATRVNAQGLVENVQILSSNLVQNPSFSEEGVQEVSNGSFSQEGAELLSQPVNLVNDFVENGGGVIVDADTFETFGGIFDGIKKSFLVVGKSYKLVIEGDTTSNGFTIGSNVASGNEYGSGFGTHYFTAVVNSVLWVRQKTSGTTNITSFSVREVGQDWTLGTGWSIGENKAVCDGTNSADIRQVGSIVGKTYKATLSVSENNVGRVNVYIGGAFAGQTTNGATGDFTFYAKATDTNLIRIRSNNSFKGSITNISVKEVGQNWTLQPKWSIGNGFAQLISNDSTGSSLIPNTSIINGNKYNCSFDAVVNSGSCKLQGSSGTTYQIIDETKTYSFNFISDSGDIYFNRLSAISNITITNVNIVEITTDTNLPRINYEGFSYQDALGSEEIVNGDFATDLSGWDLTNVNATNTITWEANGARLVCVDTNIGILQNSVLTIGKKYKFTCNVSVTTGVIALDGVTSGTTTDLVEGYNEIYFTAISTTFKIKRRQIVSNCLLDNVSVKEYSGQEVVPDSGCGSWLFEPQSTNKVTYSEDFSSWTIFDVNLTSDAIISPDGTLSGTLAASTGAPFDQIKMNTTASGDATFSVFVKKLTDDTIDFEVRGVGIGGSTGSQMRFTFSTEQLSLITNGVPSSTLVENYGNGWFRISLTYLGTTSVDSVSIIPSYASSIIRSAYIWGAMLEENSFSTSYIPTSGSSVTRNQDVCNNGGSLASINSTEGTLYAQIAALSDDLTNRVISLSNGTTNERVVMQYRNSTNRIRCFIKSGGSFYATIDKVVSDEKDFHKIAYKYKSGETKLFVDGTLIGTSTNTFSIIGLDVLQFSNGIAGDTPFFGKTKALAVWKEALSDEELADLTYPTPTDPTFALDFDTIATDFTFARGSEATYVDAQGLIKSTNEIGEEEVINGDFATDSDWNKASNVTIQNGSAIFTLAPSGQQLAQSINPTIGKQYKIVYEIKSITQGAFDVSVGSDISTSYNNSVGVYTEYLTATSTNAFYIRSRGTTNGSIDNVSVKEYITETNTPRLDYSTGAEAFLLEPQSTNLMPYSEDFSQWNKSGISIESNSLSPDGTTNASKLTATTADPHIFKFVDVGLGEVTFSFYAKANEPYVGRILFWGIGTAVVAGVTSQNFTLSNKWERYEGTINVTTAGTLAFRLDFPINSGGNVGEYGYLWGAQIEEQSYATSYIPTEGTSVTRNQETCINATPEINSEEGVLYAEIASLSNQVTSNYISLSDGTYNNRISLMYSVGTNIIRGFLRLGGVSQADLQFAVSDITEFHKVAFKFSENDFALWIDGVEVGTDTSGSTIPSGTLTKLAFSEISTTGGLFRGNTKDVQVYTKALSDAELIKLTT